MMKIHQVKGFTLIEILVVIAIAGILAAVAIPYYRDNVLKSHRSDGKAAILDVAARQEKWYFQNQRYNGDITDEDFYGTTSSPDGFYSLSIDRPCGGFSCFTIVATAAGTQEADTECYKMSVTHQGSRRSENSSGTETTDTCW